MPDRLVIVVPCPEKLATLNRIADLAVLGWERFVLLVVGSTRRERSLSARIEASKRILARVDEFGATSLIVANEVVCDRKTLEAHENLDSSFPQLGRLRDRVIKDALRAMDLDWREKLRQHLTFWTSRKSGIDEWMNQFHQLGLGWVGEGLLRQIEVIGPNDIVHGFQSLSTACYQDAILTYTPEIDPAASGNYIAGVLVKMYGRPHVNDFVTALCESERGAHLVVCEDALWTGIELRTLLGRLSAADDLRRAAEGRRITFRHCLVTDYGRWIIQHFTEHADLDFVHVSLGEGQREIRVLAETLSEATIRRQWDLPPVAFEDWLTAQVRPLAFQNLSLWRGRHQEAEQMCAEIGRQLIDRYPNEWRPPVREAFALGAARFASVMTFGHSIPKACLPLFWLGGPVTVGSATVNWFPLFYDARRARRRS